MNDEGTDITEINTSNVGGVREQDTSVTISQREYDELLYWADSGKRRISFWEEALKNPEGTTALKDGIKDVVDSTLASWAKLQKVQLKYSYIRILIVILLLGVIIGVASWLTSIGRLDGSSLIFLLGTITGYLLTFLTKMESV